MSLKILVIGTPHYDFCAATLGQGLIDFYEFGEISKLMFTEQSNYAVTNVHNFYEADENKIVKFGKDEADLIIMTSNNNVKRHLCESINRYEKTIFIDGEDIHTYIDDVEKYPLYFKREMRLDKKHNNNVKPFPFAAEKRYFVGNNLLFEDRKFNITCMFGPHDDTKPWRTYIENTVKKVVEREKINKCFVGQLYGGEQTTEIETGNRSHKNYFSVLANSKISVDGYGAHGCNSGRFWEILANGTCLLSQKRLIHMPHPFVPGEHILEFENMDELEQWILYFNYSEENRRDIKKIAIAGFDHLCKYHTTRKRTLYLLEECCEFDIIGEIF